MYICNECQKEYKEKPLYCDCGNDSFNSISNKNSAKFFDGLNNFLQRRGISLFSLSFFLGCIVLSILILLFFANPSPDKSSKDKTKTITKTNTKSIPSIDSFWKDSLPINQNKENTDVAIAIKQTSKSLNQSKTTNSVSKNNSQSKTQTKTQTKNKGQKSSSTTKKTENKVENKPASQSKPQTKPQTKSQTQGQVIKLPQETVKKQISKELIDYKIALRQALFAHLSIPSIKGNGKCGIEFSIDSTGKFINRNFTFQSENKSVNDEVYKMLMRMPKFYPPPKDYKGEKFKLVFEFSNGNYTINFTN